MHIVGSSFIFNIFFAPVVPPPDFSSSASTRTVVPGRLSSSNAKPSGARLALHRRVEVVEGQNQRGL